MMLLLLLIASDGPQGGVQFMKGIFVVGAGHFGYRCSTLPAHRNKPVEPAWTGRIGPANLKSLHWHWKSLPSLMGW